MSEAPRLSRRAVIGGAAAVSAELLMGPAAARAALGGGERWVFTRAVGRVAGLSAVIAPGRRFVLAGVTWAGPPSAGIEMRSRATGGSWGPWGAASVRGHEPDRPAGPGALAGEPVWLGVCDELQLRSAAPVGGVRVLFVSAGAVIAPGAIGNAGEVADRAGATGAAAAALPLAQPVLPAGPGQPNIIARSAWAGRRHPPAGGPFYGSIALAFVHHSDNPNGYSAAEVPAMLRAIYAFHRFARGWFDIGYNFVIDAFGRIWEARAGGIDEPVLGAQAGGYNAVSTGICMLGTFAGRLPSPAALDSLRRLLAWKLSLHGVPVTGRVRVQVDPHDASYTPFRPGQHVLLPRIAGHRDGDSTDCPGDALYARLPSLRTAVARLAPDPAQLTLSADRVVAPPGETVTLSGRLGLLDGRPLGGAPLELQTVDGLDGETTIAPLSAAADGTWSTTVAPARSQILRVLHRAAPAAVSNLVAIGITPVISLALVSAAPLRVTGTVTPAKGRVTITVYRQVGLHRRQVLTRKVPVRQGAFAVRLGLGWQARGHYVIVARTSADAVSAAGASAPLSVTV